MANIPTRRQALKANSDQESKSAIQDRARLVEEQLQAEPRLNSAARITWLIDSLSYSNGKLSMTSENIASRCGVAKRIVTRVLAEQVQQCWYQRTGRQSYMRHARWNKERFERERIADGRHGSLAVRLARIILRVASTNGFAVLSDKELMARLHVTKKPLRQARRLLREIGFEVIEGVGRMPTRYSHSTLLDQSVERAARKPESRFSKVKKQVVVKDERPLEVGSPAIGKGGIEATIAVVKALQQRKQNGSAPIPRDLIAAYRDGIEGMIKELLGHWQQRTLMSRNQITAFAELTTRLHDLPLHLVDELQSDETSLPSHLKHFLQAHDSGQRQQYLEWLPYLPADQLTDFIADLVHYNNGDRLDDFMARNWRSELAQ